MTVATSNLDGEVSARICLLKGFDERGFVFYTNYLSRKGQQIHDNPRAALVFWWQPLERQVRIEGVLVKVTEDESDAYFATRPRGSQLGAWCSEQSQVVSGGRATLETKLNELSTKYDDRRSAPTALGRLSRHPRAVRVLAGETGPAARSLRVSPARRREGLGHRPPLPVNLRVNVRNNYLHRTPARPFARPAWRQFPSPRLAETGCCFRGGYAGAGQPPARPKLRRASES